MAKERPKRCAIMIEEEWFFRAVTLAGKTRDRNPTALTRRLIKQEEERQAERERAER